MLCVALALLILTGAGVIWALVSADAVEVKDPQLKSALRAVLQSGEITDTRLAALTELDLADCGITDLTGLEKAKNLKSLSLRNNHISDLSPLASLTQLETLDLCGNEVSDLTPLAGLDALRVLQLTDNQVESLAPVANLKMLQFLFCERNKIDMRDGTAAMLTVANMRFRGTFAELGDASEQHPDIAGETKQLTLADGAVIHLNRDSATITGITPGLTGTELRAQLNAGDQTLKITNPDGKEATAAAVGTGTKIQLVNANGQVLDEFIALIYGDVNGDGSVDVIDLAMMRKQIVSDGKFLSGVRIDAANLYAHVRNDASDRVVDVIDLAMMRKVIVGSLTLSQD